MNLLFRSVWRQIRAIVDKYPVIVAAVVIYLFADLLIMNVFRHSGERRGTLDYVTEFGSLFFLWLASAALIQMQKMRKSYQQEQERRHNIERVLDRQQIYNQLVNDITNLLQDNVNNPLAIIAVTTQEIRRKFEKDDEILHWLDRIEGAMQRIHHTIRDLQAYEAQKLIESSNTALKEQVSA